MDCLQVQGTVSIKRLQQGGMRTGTQETVGQKQQTQETVCFNWLNSLDNIHYIVGMLEPELT